MMIVLQFLSSILRRSESRDLRSEIRDQNCLVLDLPSQFPSAEVVKLADTLRSGRSERKLLRVQLPPSANVKSC